MVDFNEDCGNWADAGPRRMPQAIHALRSDSRFSYTLYVPPEFYEDPSGYHLLVTVHDTTRDIFAYRDGFAPFARFNRCIVLAPLFPAGMIGDGNLDGYKHLKEGEGKNTIRYDRILLEMVDEISAALRMEFEKFLLFGYSGGGQFVHRFLYVHPSRLMALSIGAPGSITQINRDFPWWLGTKDMREVFGCGPDLEAMQKVPVQMLVGAADIEELHPPPELRKAFESIGDFSRNRIERLELLQQNFERNGIKVRFDLMPHIGHMAAQSFPTVEKFLLSILRQSSFS